MLVSVFGREEKKTFLLVGFFLVVNIFWGALSKFSPPGAGNPSNATDSESLVVDWVYISAFNGNLIIKIGTNEAIIY